MFYFTRVHNDKKYRPSSPTVINQLVLPTKELHHKFDNQISVIKSNLNREKIIFCFPIFYTLALEFASSQLETD
jgi:hypothetical protein